MQPKVYSNLLNLIEMTDHDMIVTMFIVIKMKYKLGTDLRI